MACFFALTDPDPDITSNYVVLPSIKCLTEPLARILKRCSIQVTNKPLCTLEQEFPSPKNKLTSSTKSTEWIAHGVTLEKWVDILKCEKRTHEENKTMHDWFKHCQPRLDPYNRHMIDEGNYQQRKTLESWHMAKTNNSRKLPEQYIILLHK